jgi:hypothetical protein
MSKEQQTHNTPQNNKMGTRSTDFLSPQDDESVSPAKDMEFEGKADTTLNQTGGVRNDVANMNRQNGMEEEESSTIARVRTTQPENKFVNASYDKTVNTKVLDIIKASLEKHEKTLKLKSLKRTLI